jgi:uncharacterized protein (TIGR03083 family)
MVSVHRPWIDALVESNAELTRVLASDRVGPFAGPSYCDEWSIEHVLKHLGSGADIGLLNLLPALRGDPPPPRQRYGEIIAAWNAKGSDALGAQVIETNDRYITTLANLPDDQMDVLRVHLRGRDLDISLFAGRRLFEHALHTWDISVMASPAALLVPGAATLLVDRVLGSLDVYAHGPKPHSPIRIAVSIVDRPQSFVLNIGPSGAALGTGSDRDAYLTTSSEAFVRLVTGRLDQTHTPALVNLSEPVQLETMRNLFAGAPTPTDP